MRPLELLLHRRRLLLRVRRAVATLHGGSYRSRFKGVGLAFEEVRPYSPGDDVRAIDWNVTARMGQPYVKRFVEERELCVLLLIDVSQSMAFGSVAQEKRDRAAEVAAFLTLVDPTQQNRVGAVFFTNRVERFVPPKKGPQHALRLLHETFRMHGQAAGTRLAPALRFAQRTLLRRAMIFILSDFLDDPDDYGPWLKRLGRRHDVVALRCRDPRESAWPPLPLVDVADLETGQAGTFDPRGAARLGSAAAEQAWQQLLRTARVRLIDLPADGRHLQALMPLFLAGGGRANAIDRPPTTA